MPKPHFQRRRREAPIILDTLPGFSGSAATINDILATSNIVHDMLETTVQNQLFLKRKMQGAPTASLR